MREKAFARAIVCLVSLMLPLHATAQEVEQRLERAARQLARAAEIPGISLALVRGGEVIWSGAHGVTNAETGAPVSQNTVFEAASLSKPVFAYAVLRLVDRGELELDERLWNTLAYERLEHDARAREITPRMVLTHTSGLPNWGGTPLEPSYDPGARWSYSGEGFVFLQRAVERRTGLTLNELVQREVFDPLGMARSSFVWRTAYDTSAATGHDLIGGIADKRKPEEGNAAASLHTTARDYARFLAAVLRGEGLSPSMWERMVSGYARVRNWEDGEIAPGLEWGLGWGIQEGESGRALWHWGDNGVFRAYVIGYPASGDGLVYFTNSENGLAIAGDLVSAAFPGDHPAIEWLGYWRYDDRRRLARIRLRRAFLESVEAGRRAYESITADSAQLAGIDELENLVAFLSGRNQPEGAVAVARLLTESYGDSAAAWLRLGEALTASRRYGEALESYDRALKRGPEDPENIERRKAWLREGLAAQANPPSLSEEHLQRFVGDYGPRHVRLRSGALYYERDGATAETRLIPLTSDLFALESTATFRMRFVTDSAGRPTKIVGLYADGTTDETPRSGGEGGR